MSNAPTVLKKFSSKTLLGNVRAKVAKGVFKDGELLYKAIGIVDGVKHGVSTYGPWTAFIGDFLIIDAAGNRYVSSQAFFDKTFSDALQAKLASLATNQGNGVEFALECYIAISDDYPMGFSYVAKPIVKDAVSRMAALEQRLLPTIGLTLEHDNSNEVAEGELVEDHTPASKKK